MCYKQVLSEGRTMYLLFSLAVIWCRATGGFTGVGILCCLRQLILMPRQLISISQQRPRLRSCLTYFVLTQHCTKLSSRTSLRHFGERETALRGCASSLGGKRHCPMRREAPPPVGGTCCTGLLGERLCLLRCSSFLSEVSVPLTPKWASPWLSDEQVKCWNFRSRSHLWCLLSLGSFRVLRPCWCGTLSCPKRRRI